MRRDDSSRHDRDGELAQHGGYELAYFSEAMSGVDTVFIDEGQFFADLKPTVLDLLHTSNKTLLRRVVVAGLDADFEASLFSSVLSLLPFATTVTRLTARCVACGADATLTRRRHHHSQSNARILVGGAESYESVCWQHHPSLAPPPTTPPSTAPLFLPPTSSSR
jgi:thymidine kinase